MSNIVHYCYCDYIGRITTYGYTSEDNFSLLSAPDDCRIIRTSYQVSPSTMYIDDQDIPVNRPSIPSPSKENIIADDKDVSNITGIPIGAQITVNGEVFESEEPLLEITASEAGEYLIEIKHFPYLDYKARIYATKSE